MKTFSSFLLGLLALCQVYAQAPQTFNYQAVARNNTGEPYSDQSLGVQATILTGSASGLTVFQETHTVQTNDFGLFAIPIGGGTQVSGSFQGIDWGGGESKFLEIAMDPNGGTSFQVIGTVQLLSVPYALYAATSGGDGDSDPTNEIQDLTLEENVLSISSANSITFPSGTIEPITIEINEGGSYTVPTGKVFVSHYRDRDIVVNNITVPRNKFNDSTVWFFNEGEVLNFFPNFTPTPATILNGYLIDK